MPITFIEKHQNKINTKKEFMYLLIKRCFLVFRINNDRSTKVGFLTFVRKRKNDE